MHNEQLHKYYSLQDTMRIIKWIKSQMAGKGSPCAKDDKHITDFDREVPGKEITWKTYVKI